MRGRRSELVVAALLAGAALAACGFVVVYVVDLDTQLLGLALGLALVALAAAAIIAGRALVSQEERTEERPDFTDPERHAKAEREAQASSVQALPRRDREKVPSRFAVAVGFRSCRSGSLPPGSFA